MNRDKLFPAPLRWKDLKNPRYISRKPIYDFLVQKANKLDGKLLDLGCGSMPYKSLFYMADEYIGLDIEGAEKNGFKAEGVIYYDGKNIPFKEESFDSAIAIEVFEHVESIEFVLREVFRVLKKGGKFVMTVPMVFPLHLEPWDYRRFTRYGIEKYLREAGFVNVEISNSTAACDTIRRLKIIEKKRNDGIIASKFCYLYTVFANFCFHFLGRDVENSKLTISYLITCEK